MSLLATAEAPGTLGLAQAQATLKDADRYCRWLTWATVPLHFVALIACPWWATRPIRSSHGWPGWRWRCRPTAYVPWLWFRVMDPRLLALPQIQHDLSRVNIDPRARTKLDRRYGKQAGATV